MPPTSPLPPRPLSSPPLLSPWQDIPEPLDDDAKSLADLGVETGGTIVVEELQE